MSCSDTIILVNGTGKAHKGEHRFSGEASNGQWVHGYAPGKLYVWGYAICHPRQFIRHGLHVKGELYFVFLW